jgi:hypothetical protein
MINLNMEVLDAVRRKRIPKDELIKALLRIIGPADLREILEAYEWTNQLKSVDSLPEYKSKVFTVEELDSKIDDPREDDDDEF